jgi:hypothetical protein
VPVLETPPDVSLTFGFNDKDPHFYSEFYISLEALLLQPRALRPVLDCHASSYESFELLRSQGDHDSLTSLCGGFTLFDNSEVILTPECCVDLSDLSNWSFACERTGEHRRALWIGHPALEVECDGQVVSLFYDKEFEWPKDSDFNNPIVRLSTEFVRGELKKAASLQAKLARALEPLVAESVGFPCPLGARALAGLSSSH